MLDCLLEVVEETLLEDWVVFGAVEVDETLDDFELVSFVLVSVVE